MSKNFSKNFEDTVVGLENLGKLVKNGGVNNGYPLKLFLATRDRFDLEQDMLKVWELSDEIAKFTESWMDGREGMSQDKIWSYLDALKNMHEMRMERLWETFLQVHELDGYYRLENAHETFAPEKKPAKKTSTKQKKAKTVAKKTASKKVTKTSK